MIMMAFANLIFLKPGTCLIPTPMSPSPNVLPAQPLLPFGVSCKTLLASTRLGTPLPPPGLPMSSCALITLSFAMPRGMVPVVGTASHSRASRWPLRLSL